MGESKRQLQVASLVKRIFSSVLLDSGRNIYGNILVTVTEVRMSPDLASAKIYLSVFGTEDKQATIALLQQQEFILRQQFAHKIRKRVRRVPHVSLFLDNMLDEMSKLDSLFSKLHANNDMGKEEE